jgi:hypothetical protein
MRISWQSLASFKEGFGRQHKINRPAEAYIERPSYRDKAWHGCFDK